jgi:hypothetical protein
MEDRVLQEHLIALHKKYAANGLTDSEIAVLLEKVLLICPVRDLR